MAKNPISSSAPPAWLHWVQAGNHRALRAERPLEYRTKSEQIPSGTEDFRIIEAVRQHFKGDESSYEGVLAVTRGREWRKDLCLSAFAIARACRQQCAVWARFDSQDPNRRLAPAKPEVGIVAVQRHVSAVGRGRPKRSTIPRNVDRRVPADAPRRVRK